MALSAVTTAARYRTLRRLALLQAAVLLFMVLAVPLLLLAIATSTHPGAEELGDEEVPAVGVAVPVAATAYRHAALRAAELAPGCTVTPLELAALFGDVSDHGGGHLNDEGVANPPIVIEGDGSDGGEPRRGLGNVTASAWAAHGQDGSGDGVADPQNINDAALTSAIILCRATGSASEGG